MKIKAIETVYKNYRFRSRLEARWAVFFDALGIEWEYEKEGFDFAGVYYLPDFWLKTVNMWAEVKPEQTFDNVAKKLVVLLANQSERPVLMLGGTPENRPYWGMCRDGCKEEFCLTNYHDYPQEEHRFYACPSDQERQWDDTQEAVNAAKSARFEFGEHGAR
jgi:hypothetical protein